MTGLPVWYGHRGDGDIPLQFGAARSLLDVEETKRLTHDRVVALAGSLRAGPVQWAVWTRDDGLANLREHLATPEASEVADAMAAFLADHPLGYIVAATCATDRPRVTRTPKRRSGKARR